MTMAVKRAATLSFSATISLAAAVKAYQNSGFQLSPGMEISHVVKDSIKWQVDTERDASEFDIGYYRKLLEKAWQEVAFVFTDIQS
jgi:DNA polymerase I